MNIRDWFAPGRSASLIVGLAICVFLVARGITQEVPLGGVAGKAVMSENGRPLAKALVILHPANPEDRQLRDHVATTDEKGEFAIRHLPAGDYVVEASAHAHNLHPTMITVPEGKKYVVELSMKPIAPFLEVLASQKVFTPSEKPSIELHGFAPRMGLDVSLYKLDFSKVLAKGSMQEALGPLARRWEGTPVDPSTMGSKVRSLSRDIKNRDAEGVFIDGVTFDTLAEGVYWVKCQVGGETKGTYLNITRVALVTKSAGRDVTCYVTEIDTGKPVQGAQVGYGTKNGFVKTGVTDATGLSALKVPDDGHAAVMAQYGESKALADFYVAAEHERNARIFTYTDRPVYRPGDTVRFKGIVRRLAGTEYKVPEPGKVAVEIRDPDDSLIESMTLPTNTLGTYHGEFSINKETAPGSYQIVTRFGDYKQTRYVSVSAYRKPDFSVSVTPNRPYFIHGDRAKATVKCEYYFGGPVAGAEVSVYVDRRPYMSWLDAPGSTDEDEYGDYGDGGENGDYSGQPAMEAEAGYGGGENLDEIKATTDEKGEAVIEFDTALPDDPKEAEQDYVYSLHTSVKDADNRYFDGFGQVKVVRGDVDLTVEPQEFIVGEGQTAKAVVKAKRQEDGSPWAGLRVELTSEYEVWTGRETTTLETKTRQIVTGADGTAVVDIAPGRSGDLRLTAKARDVVAHGWIYVEGGPTDNLGPKPPKLAVQLDKRNYAIGDTAKVMITTDSPGGSALLGVEGERLYSARVVELKGKVTVISLPVARDFAPNAFVAVAYVKNKKFAEATKRLVVDIGERKLNVTIDSDKQIYHPGDVARYTVHTTAAGKPTAAEVSLGVVDESVYAIAKDTTNIVESFFPKRRNAVSTNYSFPEIYLDGGDKAPPTVKVRTDFRDTAYWNPTVMTDANGVATVDVKLPDNLTQWRATAIAVTGQTQVGSATQKVRARKDLMVRLQAPAFFVQEDRQQLVALVNNDTGRDADVHVQLSADGVKTHGDLRQSVRIANGAQKAVTWTVDVPDTGDATFVAKVWIDANTTDGVQLKVPVKPHGRLMLDQQAGELRDRTSFAMTLYDGADPNTGRLRLTITPSIASALTQSLDDLIGFPYGCVEQTTDRFMPTVVVAKAMKDLHLPPPSRAKEIPAMVKEGFARLRKMQHNDGGWGWWEHDESDVRMTCYVLEALELANQAGYKASPFCVDTGVEWAKARAKEAARLPESDALYLAYVLALHDEKDISANVLAAVKFSPKQATPSESAMAVMTYLRLGNAYKSKAAASLARLIALAEGSGGVRYWKEEFWGIETTARCLQALAYANPKHPYIAQAARYLMLSRRGDMWFSTRDTAFAIIGLTHVMKALPPAQPGTKVIVKVNGVAQASVKLSQGALAEPGMKVDVPVGRLRPGDNKIELEQQAPKSGKSGVLYFSADLTQAVVRPELGEVISGGGMKIHRAYYRMESQRLEDGTLRLLPSKKPVATVQPGDIVQCVLTIQSSADREFLLVEDPLPAGCHVTERPTGGFDEEWDRWYCSTVIRYDRVAFFARRFTGRVNKITYMMRAETPGQSHALPASAYNMYDPMTRAYSGETRLEIQE